MFKALIIPYAKSLPAAYLRRLLEMAQNGLKIYILEQLPIRSSTGEDVAELLKKLSENEQVKVIPLENLIENLDQDNVADIHCSTYEPYLRYYRYEQKDGWIYMFVNEAPYQTIETEVRVPDETGNGYFYDAMTNRIKKLSGGNILKLKLSPYESAVYCFTEKVLAADPAEEYDLAESEVLKGPFEVSFSGQKDYPKYRERIVWDTLGPIQEVAGKEDFAGIIRYKSVFEVAEMGDKMCLTLDTVYEGARVSINGGEKQIRICPPYVFDITEMVRKGTNTLEIEVTTTVVREQKDWLSQYLLLEPIGITEAVRIDLYHKKKN